MSKSILIPVWLFELTALTAMLVGAAVLGRAYGNWEYSRDSSRQNVSPSATITTEPEKTPSIAASLVSSEPQVVGVPASESSVSTASAELAPELKHALDVAATKDSAEKALTPPTSQKPRPRLVSQSDGNQKVVSTIDARAKVLALTGDMAVLSVSDQQTGATTTRVVRVGDSIDGIGRVLAFHAGQGTVQTSGGLVRLQP